MRRAAEIEGRATFGDNLNQPIRKAFWNLDSANYIGAAAKFHSFLSRRESSNVTDVELANQHSPPQQPLQLVGH